MSYKSRTLTILFAAVLALSACGSADELEDSATTTTAQTLESTVVSALEDVVGALEDEGGLATASVDVDGNTYLVSCVAISPSNLSNPLGQVSYLGSDVSIRALTGVNADNAIAIEVEGGACSAGEQTLSDWSLATAKSLESGAAQQIACDSGLKVEGC